MTEIHKQLAWLIGGVLLFLVGSVWALQGAGVLPGSAMSGQTQWLVIGALVALIGLGLITLALRRGQPR